MHRRSCGVELANRNVSYRSHPSIRPSYLFQVDSAKVSADTKFEALDLDSLDIVEVVLAIEEEFAVEIPDAEADKIASISDAVSYIAAHPQAK